MKYWHFLKYQHDLTDEATDKQMKQTENKTLVAELLMLCVKYYQYSMCDFKDSR